MLSRAFPFQALARFGEIATSSIPRFGFVAFSCIPCDILTTVREISSRPPATNVSIMHKKPANGFDDSV
jgi:hypothetical protein